MESGACLRQPQREFYDVLSSILGWSDGYRSLAGKIDMTLHGSLQPSMPPYLTKRLYGAAIGRYEDILDTDTTTTAQTPGGQ